MLPPIFVLVGLTFLVLGLAAVLRNVAVMRGAVSMSYYETYTGDPPPEALERPARTYGNLLQLPILFYLLCVLMMIGDATDSVQVALAWLFVITRGLHAAVYIVFNRVPYRFAHFLMGLITLVAMWARFAAAV